MKSITITAKVKLYPTSEQMIILNKTLSVIRDVLNFVSAFVFEREGIRYPELDHALYYPVRHQFGLRSQMTQSVFKTVLAKYKSMKSNGPPFSKVSFRNFEYDLVWNRDYSISDQYISLNTFSGRAVKEKRAKALALRKRLQACGLPSTFPPNVCEGDFPAAYCSQRLRQET